MYEENYIYFINDADLVSRECDGLRFMWRDLIGWEELHDADTFSGLLQCVLCDYQCYESLGGH